MKKSKKIPIEKIIYICVLIVLIVKLVLIFPLILLFVWASEPKTFLEIFNWYVQLLTLPLLIISLILSFIFYKNKNIKISRYIFFTPLIILIYALFLFM